MAPEWKVLLPESRGVPVEASQWRRPEGPGLSSLQPTGRLPPRRLKTIHLVIRSTQGAEELVRKYEEQLKEVQAVPADLKALEETKAELKVAGRAESGWGLVSVEERLGQDWGPH